MLSFDITDRNIRIVRGSETSGKIKVTGATTINLEEELIVNGYVRDVPTVATIIHGVLKKNRMTDKEAIVSISSNLTIFKEINVPKVAKAQELPRVVRQQMQAELNLDDSYSITYVIVGETTGENGDQMLKILATACPYQIIDSYKEVFKYLNGVSLKSVMVGCNCITKVLLADTKIRSKMPLLAVQIDNNFISLNLYEQGQLSFSRFASIDPSDYDGSPDYVFEAVSENIYRMLQFHRSRNTGETIENVIFYGDTHEYVRLTDELEKYELNTSLINVPPQIHGHENLEFSLYANAIGAMFKRNRDTEKINLLETELGSTVKKAVKSDNSGTLALLAGIIVPFILMGGIVGVMALKNLSIKHKIEDIQEWIDSDSTKKQLRHEEKLEGMRDSVREYNTRMNNAHDGFFSNPVIDGDKFDVAEDVLAKTAEDLGIEKARIIEPKYEDGILKFKVKCDSDDELMAQELPAQYVENLLSEKYSDNKGYYEVAGYSGYEVVVEETVAETGEGENRTRTVLDSDEHVEFDVEIGLKGRESAYKPDTSEPADAETAETADDAEE